MRFDVSDWNTARSESSQICSWPLLFSYPNPVESTCSLRGDDPTMHVTPHRGLGFLAVRTCGPRKKRKVFDPQSDAGFRAHFLPQHHHTGGSSLSLLPPTRLTRLLQPAMSHRKVCPPIAPRRDPRPRRLLTLRSTRLPATVRWPTFPGSVPPSTRARSSRKLELPRAAPSPSRRRRRDVKGHGSNALRRQLPQG